ncbi:phage T7 F exclusion suppressor FxsA [Roseovarius albus]|uniref:Phage T7 F exclusion suppressor FxsA n=1 Tax=Roseovarius albus TaxID=1247867 RepID=A0A1X6Z596_9RHOB|nr:FxsA family protein [Roseovarius albus]SLN40579.1 phage T7 F exclusion suppressor FxsA [Roseovarius albus]
MWLFIAFLAVPLIEIALFIQVGGLIGLWPTLAVVILTAILGTWLVRSQGRSAMNDLRGSFSQLDDPSEPLAHGAMILFSGALLLTPGFFTDAVGFALLAPPIRKAIIAYAKTRINVQHIQMGPNPRGQHHNQPNSDVIDGDFFEVNSDNTVEPGDSGWTKH